MVSHSSIQERDSSCIAQELLRQYAHIAAACEGLRDLRDKEGELRPLVRQLEGFSEDLWHVIVAYTRRGNQ